MTYALKSLPEKLRKRLTIDPETGCWLWQGGLEKGYGVIQIRFEGQRSSIRAHVKIYQLLVGGIPTGKLLHHECENRRCCNPEHLKPLTTLEHNRWHRAKKKWRRGPAARPGRVIYIDRKPLYIREK